MRRVRAWLMLAALGAVLTAGATANASPSPGAALSTPPPHWQFLKRRNEALGAWLPHGEDIFEPRRRKLAAPGPLGNAEMFTVPAGATSFWYGDAGPPRVQLVYDPAHRIALYRQWCCSWEESVLMSVAKPPPRPVRTANLLAVRNAHGISLGASPGEVRGAYGPAKLHASTTTPALRVLSYYRVHKTQGTDCGWYDNFVFRANRLVEIQAGHGC